MVRLDYLIQSWKTVRAATVEAVEDFPADQFGYRATDDLMTFRELALHILDAGNALTGLLLSGETNMQTPDFREKIKVYFSGLGEQATPAELASGLRSSIDPLCEKLAAQSPEFFSQMIMRFDGQQTTRMEMLMMIKEHEMTHRSQMFTYLRLKGIVPGTTRRRLAKK